MPCPSRWKAAWPPPPPKGQQGTSFAIGNDGKIFAASQKNSQNADRLEEITRVLRVFFYSTRTPRFQPTKGWNPGDIGLELLGGKGGMASREAAKPLPAEGINISLSG